MFLKLSPVVVVVSSLVLLGTFGTSSLAWEISSSGALSPSHCAKVFMQKDFEGQSFYLKDKEHVPYLRDLHDWDETAEISAKVKSSCVLRLGTQPFLQGTHHDLTGDIQEFKFEGTNETFQNSSVMCSCRKSCSCEDIVFRGRECARGYFNSDCTNCDAHYTSFRQNEGRTKFPTRFESAVTSFIVRPTCKLIVQYKTEPNGKLETQNIQTTTKAEIVPFSGTISSTSCKCDTSSPDYLGSPERKTKPSDPPLLSIPNLRGAINAELKKAGQENHPGLLAALQSLRAKRSPKNAYILLLGLTGSGKSTAVNLLFDHPNITQVGSAQSTTTDIHEFRIPVQVNEMGIGNSELRIIDTPGIADTRGIAQDARFLATLDQFLSKHEELKKSVPNLILICVKFHDNRFDGSGSAFVKMLKTIELFRSRLVDPKYSNIIFVLTHFMSETKEIQRNPGPKIERFKRVIEEYSSLPKPIVLVVAENKPDASELPSVNGYWSLPNGDHYPKNLFDQMQRTLSSCGDPIGLGVIQSAFSHSGEFKIEGRTFPILPATQKNVVKYLSTLSALEMPPSSTEVTEAIDSAFKELSPELKSKYPSVLTHIKRICALRNINLLSRIPKTSVKILEFLKDVQMNEASLFLLQRGLNIEVPRYPGSYVVGSGYDLINDSPLTVPIFNLSSGFYPSEIGFQLPENVKVSLSNAMRNVFSILPDRNEYVEMRLQNLGLEQDGKGLDQLLSSSGGTKAGLNIVTSPDQRDLKLSALIEYQTFHIMLDKESTVLSEDYLRDLRALGPFDTANFESVRLWNRFFQLYGTHAVVGASGGGNIEVEVKLDDYFATPVNTPEQIPEDYEAANNEEEQNDEGAAAQEKEASDDDYDSANKRLHSQVDSIDRFTRLSQTMGLILQYLANNFLGTETPVTIPEGVVYTIKMRGGDPKFHITNSNLNLRTRGNVELFNILDKWQSSVRYQPEILTSYLKLIPMSEILQNFPGLESEAAAVAEASRGYLNASLVYVQSYVVDNSLEDREHSGATTMQIGDFQSVQEFAQIFESIAAQSQKSQETFMNMMMELKKENQRQDELFQQRQREDMAMEMERQRLQREEERYQDEVKFRRDQLEFEREKDERAMRAQMYATDAQLKAQQAAQMMEMEARNHESFMNLMMEQSRMQTQLAIAEMNKKTWFDKTLEFLGGQSQQATQVLPYLAAAG